MMRSFMNSAVHNLLSGEGGANHLICDSCGIWHELMNKKKIHRMDYLGDLRVNRLIIAKLTVKKLTERRWNLFI